jgi:hypothetical protein
MVISGSVTAAIDGGPVHELRLGMLFHMTRSTLQRDAPKVGPTRTDHFHPSS